MLSTVDVSGDSICVIGNINRDIKMNPLPVGDYLFRDGETSTGSVSETIGGGGANSAFTAVALGAKTSFLGKIGTDGLGRRLDRTLAQHGIIARLARDKSQPSGTSIALSFDNGQRHFISCLPANRALTFADLDLSILRGQGHLLRADVWFSEPMLYGGNKELFEQARQLAVPISLDLNWDPHWGEASAGNIPARKQAVRDVLPWVALAHGNARELMMFSDAETLDTALRRITEWGAGGIVVHLGEKGAGYYSQGVLEIEPPAAVRSMVNTAGTGDVLSVCMMLLHQHPEMIIKNRLRLSNDVVGEFIEGRRQFIPNLAD